MGKAENIIKQAVALEKLDSELYKELQEWGLFYSCPIKAEDLREKSYFCGVLRTNGDMYAGMAIFQENGSHAIFLYIEIIQNIRGRKLGKLLFKQTVSLLKEKGITEIIAADPVDIGKAEYMAKLGFICYSGSTYMEYSYHELMNSLLYHSLSALDSRMKNVVNGREIDDSLRAAYIRELEKKGINSSVGLICADESLFYLDHNGSIKGHLGIGVWNDSKVEILDQALIEKKVKGVDARLVLLGRILRTIEQADLRGKGFKLIYMADDPETEKGFEVSLGIPNIKKLVYMYKYCQ